MNSTALQKYTLLFWLLVSIHLAAIFFDSRLLLIISKALLMPALGIILLRLGKRKLGKMVVAAGLFFSWAGDIFLSFQSSEPLFFIAGLASFLITHILYITFFLSIKSVEPSLLKQRPLYIVLVLCYGAALVLLLFPYLGQLKMPVTLYAFFICAMWLCSIHIYLKVNKPANWHYLLGAGLFVLSDSLLAFNKFYQPLPLSGLLIILTYCAAQYFIVRGFITMGNKDMHAIK